MAKQNWIQMPDDSWVDFGDASDDEIRSAIESEYPEDQQKIASGMVPQVPSALTAQDMPYAGPKPKLPDEIPPGFRLLDGQVVQDPNYMPQAFNPDMALQSITDIGRNMSRAITFGGMDYVAPYLGSGRTVEQEQAETEAMKKRLAPSVRVGTGVAADMLLPVGELAGMLAKPAKQAVQAVLPKGGWKAQVGKELDAQTAIQEAQKKVVVEGLTKDTAKRKAFDEFGKNTKYKLTPDEMEKLNKVIYGGPVRNAAVSVGKSKKGNVSIPALITTGMAGEFGGVGGIKTAALLGTLGLLAKGVKSGAKAVGNRLGERDVQEFIKVIKKGGVK